MKRGVSKRGTSAPRKTTAKTKMKEAADRIPIVRSLKKAAEARREKEIAKAVQEGVSESLPDEPTVQFKKPKMWQIEVER